MSAANLAVRSFSGTVELMAVGNATNTTTQKYPQITLANSGTYQLMNCTGCYGELQIYDNTGQRARLAVTPGSCSLINATSHFVIGNSATAAQLAINVTANPGNLTIYVGSGAATNITSWYSGMFLPWPLILMGLLRARRRSN